MDREDQDLDVIELGAVSAETKGFTGPIVDLPGGQGIAGILDD